MTTRNEAIEKKLQKAINMLITDGHYEGRPNQTDDDSCPVCMIDQALEILKAEQPPASDKVTLDKGSLTYCKEHKIIYLRKLPCPLCLQARLDASEASRNELAKACKKVRDWLDTSSLQQVLVHYTEDKRKHALIMGIASHLERLEAAIEKETNIQTKEK